MLTMELRRAISAPDLMRKEIPEWQSWALLDDSECSQAASSAVTSSTSIFPCWIQQLADVDPFERQAPTMFPYHISSGFSIAGHSNSGSTLQSKLSGSLLLAGTLHAKVVGNLEVSSQNLTNICNGSILMDASSMHHSERTQPIHSGGDTGVQPNTKQEEGHPAPPEAQNEQLPRKGTPRCVCSWKNCRTYQKAFRSVSHPVMDGVVKMKFSRSDKVSMQLKASVDRQLKVNKEARDNWKSRKGVGTISYYIARHHFTEAHICRYRLSDRGLYQWTSLFTQAEAEKYLFKVDPKETYDGYYLQCPTVSKQFVKEQFLKIKAEFNERANPAHTRAMAEAIGQPQVAVTKRPAPPAPNQKPPDPPAPTQKPPETESKQHKATEQVNNPQIDWTDGEMQGQGNEMRSKAKKSVRICESTVIADMDTGTAAKDRDDPPVLDTHLLETSSYRTELADLVNRVMPHKMANIDVVMEQFHGREQDVIFALQVMLEMTGAEEERNAAKDRDHPQDIAADLGLADQQDIPEAEAEQKTPNPDRSQFLDKPHSKQQRSLYRDKVVDLVNRVIPHEQDNINDMMDQFHGREQDLIDTLQNMSGKSSTRDTWVVVEPADQSPQHHEEKESAFRAKVEKLVNQVIPHERDNIDDMMEQFRGREQDMIDTLQTMQETSSRSDSWIVVEDKEPKANPQRSSYRKEAEDLVNKVIPHEGGNIDDMMDHLQGREKDVIDILKAILAHSSAEDTSPTKTDRDDPPVLDDHLLEASYREEVEELVNRVIPHESGNIDDMMEQFRGHEQDMIETLQTMCEQSGVEDTGSPVKAQDEPQGADKNPSYRDQVEDLVKRVIPDELGNLDDMMDQFRGREHDLIDTLQTMWEMSGCRDNQS